MIEQKKKWIIGAAAAAVVAVIVITALTLRDGRDGPVLHFLGAAREVGGSSLLVETGEGCFLVDCGAFGEAGLKVLPPDPERVGFVVVTHAHGDHCGLLPELCAAGFRGTIYCTPPTARLVPVMLRMSRGISRNKVPREDFDRALQSIEAVPFGETVERDNVSFTFHRAEHLLGAAFVEACIRWEGREITVVFSGDLGAGNSALLQPLERCVDADYVVMESTYGGVVRCAAVHDGAAAPGDAAARSAAEQWYRPFAEAVGNTLRGGGDVLIPSFTLGRTQEVCAVIDLFRREGVIPPETDVYVDSPTAKKVTVIYRRFADELSRAAREFYSAGMLRSPYLHEIKSRVSLAVHERAHDPAIFVSSSGDLGFANSPRHLMKMFGDPDNLLCIVGWQSPGSLGSRLVAGDSPVLVRYREGRRFRSEWISPALSIERITLFSGHADQRGLLDWLGSARGVRTVFLVHGEADQSEKLAEMITTELGLDVEVPRRGEKFTL